MHELAVGVGYKPLFVGYKPMTSPKEEVRELMYQLRQLYSHGCYGWPHGRKRWNMTVLVLDWGHDSAPLSKQELVPQDRRWHAFVEGHCPRDMQGRARTPMRDVHAHRQIHCLPNRHVNVPGTVHESPLMVLIVELDVDLEPNSGVARCQPNSGEQAAALLVDDLALAAWDRLAQNDVASWGRRNS